MDAEQVLNIAVHTVAIASVIAAVTPTPIDNAALIVVRKVLDAVAFNFGGAKNHAHVEAEKFKQKFKGR